MPDNRNTVFVIGAGPAGLTAAAELVARGKTNLAIAEELLIPGGLSRTENYKGNRIDIGGHRFFSKSKEVMDWWFRLFPLQGQPSSNNKSQPDLPFSSDKNAPAPETDEKVMLVRKRVSHILYLGKLFDYPLSLSLRTVRHLGIVNTVLIAFSYLHARLRPVTPETSLEDFVVNRFGRKLYTMFFEKYTEKVWGVPCRTIDASWGAQRIRGLSIGRALRHALFCGIARDPRLTPLKQEISLIGRFCYPKRGPGQLWEAAAEQVQTAGANIRYGHRVISLRIEQSRIESVTMCELASGIHTTIPVDALFSTMPVRDLVLALEGNIPDHVRNIAAGLVYRDFITVGLLLRKFASRFSVRTASGPGFPEDTWTYIQEPHVRVGRVQFFNNWSPYLAADNSKPWVGLEFFCTEGDAFWNLSSEQIVDCARKEAAAIGLADPEDILDSVVVRAPKAYPAYFGTYDRFGEVRTFLDSITNLYCIGRNGMHRYNNADHSMLSAIKAVQLHCGEHNSRSAVWDVNADADYHEES